MRCLSGTNGVIQILDALHENAAGSALEELAMSCQCANGKVWFGKEGARALGRMLGVHERVTTLELRNWCEPLGNALFVGYPQPARSFQGGEDYV